MRCQQLLSFQLKTLLALGRFLYTRSSLLLPQLLSLTCKLWGKLLVIRTLQ